MTTKQLPGEFAPDGSLYITLTDGSGNLVSVSGISSAASTSVDLTAGTDISAGTAVSINSSGQAVQGFGPAPNVEGLVSLGYCEKGYSVSSILQLSSTVFVAFLTGNTIGGAVVCTISGDTITVGELNTSVPFSNIEGFWSNLTSSPNSSLAAAVALTPTTFAIAYDDGGNSGYGTTAICTVSGTTLTVDTTHAAVFSENAIYEPGWVSLVSLSSTLYEIAYVSQDGNTYIVAVTVSGTTPTAGTPVVVVASNDSGYVELKKITGTTSLCIYYNPAGNGGDKSIDAVVASVSGTTISLGTPTSGTAFGGPDAIIFNTAQLTSTTYALSGARGDGAPSIPGVQTSYLGCLALITVSGTSVSFGDAINIPFMSILETLDSTHIIVAPSFNPNGTFPYFDQVTQGSALSPIPNGFMFSPEIYTLVDGVFTGNAFKASSNYAFGPIAVQSATEYVYTGTSATGTTFTIYQGDSSGRISLGLNHYGLVGYWLYPLTSTTVLATLMDTTNLLSARIINLNSINSTPIGFASSAIGNGDVGTITVAGVASGFSGLEIGSTYYINGDGTLTTANTGILAGAAISSSEIVIAS